MAIKVAVMIGAKWSVCSPLTLSLLLLLLLLLSTPQSLVEASQEDVASTPSGQQEAPASFGPFALVEQPTETDAQVQPPSQTQTVHEKALASKDAGAEEAESEHADNKEAASSEPIEEGPRDSVDEPKTTEATTIEPAEPAEQVECMDTNYCLNGGTCVMRNGKKSCICPESFYGARCQTRNICKTIIADSLTGDQICAKIERECELNDRFLRCSCSPDEYFVFELNQPPETAPSGPSRAQAEPGKPAPANHRAEHDRASFSYQPTLAEIMSGQYKETSAQGTAGTPEWFRGDEASASNATPTAYLAECRKIDKCLGVRCRQLSEKCESGVCVCNQDTGYIKDPTDGLCKLLDPCKMPTPDGEPICGQAQCVATYDREMYRCVCPVGYKVVKVGSERSSTQCGLLYDTICQVPLLNKCQHTCTIDRRTNAYKCSCLPGYRPGARAGVDDHLCFFEENIEQLSFDYLNQLREASPPDAAQAGERPNLLRQYVYKKYPVARKATRSELPAQADDKIIYNPVLDGDGAASDAPEPELPMNLSSGELDTDDYYIKREPRRSFDRTSGADAERNLAGVESSSQTKLSAQDRCNMFCDENKICVLESGSTDSYRCICDRQGYVSVGDRCLDWCSAAEFSYSVRNNLMSVCLSGICKQTGPRLSASEQASSDDELAKLERGSSWRPKFECDCSHSPLLVQDPNTRLCQLDFQAILSPCLPGNIGYQDCVETKNAYCAVLHQPIWALMNDLRRAHDSADEPTSQLANKKVKAKEDKLYTCVCSPEKKLLVDKPRNKARCVGECDLLNIECGRFNRMCRSATMAPDDFGQNNLVREDPEGTRMFIKRTSCECLPGFNAELVDFTLDDNADGEPKTPSGSDPTNLDGFLPPTTISNNNLADESEHLRTKYMNINSRCLLDYDVVEFHASFRIPPDFDPNWLPIRDGRREATPRGNEDDQKDTESQSSASPAPAFPSLKQPTDSNVLELPEFMHVEVSKLHRSVVLVGQCEPALASLNIEMHRQCIRYRYWLVQKLRNHFIDWRKLMTNHLAETFALMEGNVRLRINKCEASLRDTGKGGAIRTADELLEQFDPMDQSAVIDADVHCELTLHSASDNNSPGQARKVLLEKQLPKFIFNKQMDKLGDDYYLMAPDMLIKRESFDQLAEHRKLFNPCNSDYAYCDKQTKCEMVDAVNFTCTCDYGYTPIGSRDVYKSDSRKEVCEDINECLFDVCKKLANVSTCINEIGDYRCQCNRHHTGDNKSYCTHVCNTIPCKHGKCRLVDDHHAFCECEDGYKEADCSVLDPSVALRKANIIICSSIFASVLLLAVTLAISLNSQLRKTKKKLKRLEAAQDAAQMFEFSHQQPFRPRLSKTSACS